MFLFKLERARNNVDCANRHLERADSVFGDIGNPYWIGIVKFEKAMITMGEESTKHLNDAANAWSAIGRDDLVEQTQFPSISAFRYR